MTPKAENPIFAGTALAVLAAIAFGVTTPILQRNGRGVGPFVTAGLLYAGAAMLSLPSIWGRAEREAPLRISSAKRVFLVAVFGAVLAPTCLAWGIQRTGAVTASLLLNFESIFTVTFAWLLFREHVGRRVLLAMLVMAFGGVVLVASGLLSSSATIFGSVAILAATGGWALDNALTRPLADVNPAQVVFWKASTGAVLSLLASRIGHESLPNMSAALSLLGCGATGYGLSLRLYLLAQRRIGAGRTGSIFAVAPFVGAISAWAAGDRTMGLLTLAAAVLFAVGVYIHLSETHGHEHRHAALEHEHAHRHDDKHHEHTHDPAVEGAHSHLHRHEAGAHEHPHAPDLHHRHDHN